MAMASLLGKYPARVAVGSNFSRVRRHGVRSGNVKTAGETGKPACCFGKRNVPFVVVPANVRSVRVKVL